jgi:hypothetical protein
MERKECDEHHYTYSVSGCFNRGALLGCNIVGFILHEHVLKETAEGREGGKIGLLEQWQSGGGAPGVTNAILLLAKKFFDFIQKPF